MEKRNRNNRLSFRVNDNEKKMIDEKMAQLHTKNKEAYLRKVAIDGRILNLDMEPIKELAAVLRANGNNINQIGATRS